MDEKIPRQNPKENKKMADFFKLNPLPEGHKQDTSGKWYEARKAIAKAEGSY